MKKGSSKAKKESGESASRFLQDKEEDEKKCGEKKSEKEKWKEKTRRRRRGTR